VARWLRFHARVDPCSVCESRWEAARRGEVGFTDGTERIIDVERYLRGPVFHPIRNDRSMFEAVSVDAELGVVVWPNGADIDPDVLYGFHEPAWADLDRTPND
jgi:hypothetical protein